MGSDAMIYIPSLIKIGSPIQYIQTHREHSNHISLLLFFQNKESRLKIGHEKGNIRNSIKLGRRGEGRRGYGVERIGLGK
jgi:hypothetical protein